VPDVYALVGEVAGGGGVAHADSQVTGGYAGEQVLGDIAAEGPVRAGYHDHDFLPQAA
jgi:hypothetical protein